MSRLRWHPSAVWINWEASRGCNRPTSLWPTTLALRWLPPAAVLGVRSVAQPRPPHPSHTRCVRSPPLLFPRFTYSSYRPYAKRVRELQQRNAVEREAAGVRLENPPLSLPATVPDLDPSADDAFGTVMAWLYHRIPHTR